MNSLPKRKGLNVYFKPWSILFSLLWSLKLSDVLSLVSNVIIHSRFSPLDVKKLASQLYVATCHTMMSSLEKTLKIFKNCKKIKITKIIKNRNDYKIKKYWEIRF